MGLKLGTRPPKRLPTPLPTLLKWLVVPVPVVLEKVCGRPLTLVEEMKAVPPSLLPPKRLPSPEPLLPLLAETDWVWKVCGLGTAEAVAMRPAASSRSGDVMTEPSLLVPSVKVICSD